jgi:hypothetical protein
MKPLTDNERLLAALAIARSIHENMGFAERYPSGTSITPVGTENGELYIAITEPKTATNMEMERVTMEAPRPPKRTSAGKKQQVYA